MPEMTYSLACFLWLSCTIMCITAQDHSEPSPDFERSRDEIMAPRHMAASRIACRHTSNVGLSITATLSPLSLARFCGAVLG
jgi:hypothetical protein